MYRLATIHEFSIHVVIDVSNINEAWPASAWWWRQSNSALWESTVVNSASMEGTMSLHCCWGGDYGILWTSRDV